MNILHAWIRNTNIHKQYRIHSRIDQNTKMKHEMYYDGMISEMKLGYCLVQQFYSIERWRRLWVSRTMLWILLVRRFVRFSHSGLVQLECVYWWCRLGLGMVGLNYSFYIKIISCILYFWFYDFFAEMVGDAKFYFLFISTFNFLKFISVSRREFIRWTAVELYDDATDLQNSCDPNGFGVVCRVFVRILMF